MVCSLEGTKVASSLLSTIFTDSGFTVYYIAYQNKECTASFIGFARCLAQNPLWAHFLNLFSSTLRTEEIRRAHTKILKQFIFYTITLCQIQIYNSPLEKRIILQERLPVNQSDFWNSGIRFLNQTAQMTISHTFTTPSSSHVANWFVKTGFQRIQLTSQSWS